MRNEMMPALGCASVLLKAFTGRSCRHWRWMFMLLSPTTVKNERSEWLTNAHDSAVPRGCKCYNGTR